MEYRSRTFRIDDEVWAAIQKHELSANKLLRVALGLDTSSVSVTTAKPGHFEVRSPDKFDGAAPLDAVGSRLSDGRGKVTRETRKGGKR